MNITNKIINKKLNVGIIGLGYVGLQLALRFCDSGFKVIGIDIDSEKIKFLKKGKSYLSHISEKKVSKHIKSKFFVSSNFNYISEVDVIIVCVPTPLGRHNDPDLSFITQTLDSIKEKLKKIQKATT